MEIREFSLRGGLYENDIRLLADLARDNAKSDSDAIFAAFGQIALEGRLENEKWFRALANQIATETPSMPLTRERLAVQLFSRGLAAAHALRLVYIDDVGGVLYVRFRHRRLAEYFAACYFSDRWHEFERLDSSPWLTPVLNLVAAIEGDSCRAFNLLVNRVVGEVPDRAFEWRSSITDAAESAAFTQKGPRYREVLQRFVKLLITATDKLSLDGAKKHRKKRDLASQFSAINAIGFVGELDSGDISLPKKDIDRAYHILRRLPAPFVTHTVRAAFSLSRLTANKIPHDFRFDMIVALIRHPSALVKEFRSARRYGFVLEWCAAAFAMIASEAVAYLAFTAAIVTAVILTMDQSSKSTFLEILKLLSIPTFLFWAISRALYWRRSSTYANYINQIIINVITFSVAFIVAIAIAPFVLIYAIVANAKNIFGWAKEKLVLLFAEIAALARALWRWLIGLRLHYRRILLGVLALSLFGGGLWGLGTLTIVAWQEAKGSRSAESSKPDSKVGGGSTANEEPARDAGLGPTKAASVDGGNAEQTAQTDSERAKCTATRELSDMLVSDASRRVERAAEVEQWRQGLTDLAAKIVASERVSSCLDWWKDGPATTTEVFKLLRERNVLAVPVRTDGPATFNRRDFESLQTIMQIGSSATNNPSRFESISGVSGLEYLRRANEADEAHSQLVDLFDRLDGALLDGKITTDPSGKYPDQDEFMHMMAKVRDLHSQKEGRLKSLVDSASSLRWEAIRALGRFVIIMFGLLGCGLLIRSFRRDRFERRYLDDAATLEFEGLLDRMSVPNISDRVRTGLASILSEVPVERSQVSPLLLKLESLIQGIEASDKPRDIKFAAELTIALDRISRRFA